MKPLTGIIAAAIVFVSLTFTSVISWANINGDLVTAARKGDIEAVKSYIAKGADVNAKDSDGLTALQFAARWGHLDCVKALLASGADVDEADSLGWTALMLSAVVGHVDCVKTLIDNGADVNAKNSEGWTVLILAATYGHADCVQTLIDNGADVNAKNSEGCTVLILAVIYGYVDCVQTLIDNGADVNAKNPSGATALMAAADKDNAECAKILIANGADVNATDSNGNTAMKFADDKGFKDIVEILQDAVNNLNSIENYTEKIQAKPDVTSNYFNRGECYRRIGQYDKALNDYQKYIDMAPKSAEKSAEGYGGKAYTFYEMRRYEEAIANADKCIELESQKDVWGLVLAYGIKGGAYLGLKEYASALDAYYKQLELRPQAEDQNSLMFEMAYMNVARVYYNIGVYEEALCFVNKSIDMCVLNDALLLKANILIRMKRFKEAWKAYDDMRNPYPSQAASAYNGKGWLFGKAGGFKEAFAEYDKVLKIYPNKYTYNYRGYDYIMLKNYDAAIKDFKQTLSMR